LDDKHKAGSVIVIRPLVEMNRRVDYVLDAVQDDRSGSVGHA
jgi:hypothetical protein